VEEGSRVFVTEIMARFYDFYLDMIASEVWV
jgi:hypothetical protein